MYRFHTTCHTSNLATIRRFVGQKLQTLGIDEQSIDLMVLAVDEVCANLILHSNQNNSEPLEIRILPGKEGVEFDIRDKGIFFNYTDYEPPALDDIRKQQRRGGLGLLLVRRIMDHVQYERNTAFNSCRLYKRVAYPAQA
jgi:serine/threonine-protein kinase RsbW